LQAAYGNALIAARGYSARETEDAFAKARDMAVGDADAPERLAADFGLWVGSYIRGELPAMRTRSAMFLNDVAGQPNSPEAGVAHRAAGITHWFVGEYREAQKHFECALALFAPGRDDDLAFRFGHDPGVAATLFLALTIWPLGDVTGAIALVERAQKRMEHISHASSRANGKMHAAMFELARGNLAKAASNSLEFGRITCEHGLAFQPHSSFLEGWAKSQRGAIAEAITDMQRSAKIQSDHPSPPLNFHGLMKIAQANVEAQAGEQAHAIATINKAIATSDRVGHRTFDGELHRVRGELLLCHLHNPVLAEEALKTAIAVSRQQRTRSFELRAALALARLYQSTARPADGHAVLARALEGFSPTPEMPEIAEAQALLERLARAGEGAII
jgi:tetratricopeptide (TPR) repeat protein